MTVPSALARVPGWDRWLAELDELGPPPDGLEPPSPDEVAAVLATLEVPAAEIGPVVAALPSPGPDADRWWLLQRAVHRLTIGLGRADGPGLADRLATEGRGPWGPWPDVPASLGPGWDWFHLHMLLAAVPAARREYARRGFPDDVAMRTLTNIGRNVGLHREITGGAGVHAVFWLVLPIRAALVHVGRLQFLPTGAPWSWAGAPFEEGDAVLDLHIPPTGPLDPAAVDASFVAARALFRRAEPEADSGVGVCSSWLLDPQLRTLLPDDTNILRFQRRFTLDPDWAHPDDAGTVEFVFRRRDVVPDDLPRRTRLERAIADHLAAGGHWNVRRGWCPVSAGPWPGP